jgi:hypothetical protein
MHVDPISKVLASEVDVLHHAETGGEFDYPDRKVERVVSRLARSFRESTRRKYAPRRKVYERALFPGAPRPIVRNLIALPGFQLDISARGSAWECGTDDS